MCTVRLFMGELVACVCCRVAGKTKENYSVMQISEAFFSLEGGVVGCLLSVATTYAV